MFLIVLTVVWASKFKFENCIWIPPSPEFLKIKLNTYFELLNMFIK